MSILKVYLDLVSCVEVSSDHVIELFVLVIFIILLSCLVELAFDSVPYAIAVFLDIFDFHHWLISEDWE